MKWTLDERRRLRTLVQEGRSKEEIGRILGRSARSVADWMERQGLASTYYKGVIHPSRHWELRLDWEDGVPISEMAKKFCCGRSTISVTAQRLGLKKRPNFPHQTVKQAYKVEITPWPEGVQFEDDPNADRVGKRVIIPAYKTWTMV